MFSGSLIPLHIYSQVVYKLTDFGYAKSYNKSSVCTSLVGMVQYVVSVHMINIVLRLFRLFGYVLLKS